MNRLFSASSKDKIAPPYSLLSYASKRLILLTLPIGISLSSSQSPESFRKHVKSQPKAWSSQSSKPSPIHVSWQQSPSPEQSIT